jgi:tRNA pseudouridine38-40 synthase
MAGMPAWITHAAPLWQEQYKLPQQANFSRAARTDKGVHAIRQVVALKAHMGPEVTPEGINAYLPPAVAPTYAFMPDPAAEPTPAYRMPAAEHARLNALLAQYQGTHNFHNFTSQKAASDPSAQRYLMRVEASVPRVHRGLEVVTIAVTGQSFMIHQIRKMVGLVAAIMRGHAAPEALPRAFAAPRRAVPIIPGLGLYLDAISFASHNRRMAELQAQPPLVWDLDTPAVAAFKDEMVVGAIVDLERETGEIRTWLQSLGRHDYGAAGPECSGNVQGGG